MALARRDVDLILARGAAGDDILAGDRGLALRALLYLFERDAAARYARTG